MPQNKANSTRAKGPPYRAVSDEFVRRWGKTLSSGQWSVMLALMSFHRPGRKGLVWPRLSTLGERAGMSRRQTIADAVRGLEKLGLVDVIDWPLWTEIGTRNGEPRKLGGGQGKGRGFVYRLLHVDERCLLHAEPVRASAKQLQDYYLNSLRLQGEIHQLVITDPPDSAIVQALIARWPSLSGYERLQDPADDRCWSTLSDTLVLALGCNGAYDELARIWPLEGGSAPISELVLDHPAMIKSEERGCLASSDLDRDVVRRAMGEAWPAISRELVALNQTYGRDRRIGLDNIGSWRFTAPTLARVCERFGIGQCHAELCCRPYEDEGEDTPQTAPELVGQEVA